MLSFVPAKSLVLLVVGASISLCAMPSTAEARGIVLPLDAQIAQALIVLLSASSHCVELAHDRNGNRQSRSISTVGSAGANWGSGKFGCLVWHS